MKELSAEKEKDIIRSFQQVCDLLEKENSFLVDGNLEEVIKIFPEKKKVLSLLEKNISLFEKDIFSFSDEGRDKFFQGMKEIIDIFNVLSNKNKLLLKTVVDTQNSILKIILVDSDNDKSKRYSSFGEYTKNNHLYSALTLRSDV